MIKVKLVNHTPDPERAIELAYLACRNPDPWNPKHDKTLEQRIDAIWKSKHFPVFEFADATFYISGVSRSCSHQFVRHRLASYGQLSMRHVDLEELEFIMPMTIEEVGMKENFKKFTDAAHLLYNSYRRLKIPKQDARFAVPISIETRFMVKMNFRSWIHFLKLRMHRSAQWEIREVANQIYAHLREIAPNIFSEWYMEFWDYV